MTKRSVRTHRIDMKKKYTLRRKYFLGDQKWSYVNKMCVFINEILVRSLDLVGNFQNIATLPTKFLCEFFELDRNKIYWVHLRNAISSKMQ